MLRFSFDWRTSAAYALLGGFAFAGAPLCPAQPASSSPIQKKYKEGEYEIVSQTYKDAGDPAQELTDLDTWSQKFPDSDYRDDRAYLYIQAALKLNQPAKVLEHGARLMARDIAAVFSSSGTEQLAGLPIKLTMLNVLYSVALNAASLDGASAEQLALGERAAAALVEFAPRYFVPENKPAAQTDAAWASARAEILSKAQTARIAIALKPGLEARQKQDCPGQEAAFSKACADFPESGAATYQYGVTLLTCEASSPVKVATGLWEIARVSTLDAAKSGLDPKDIAGIQTYLTKVYTRIHGSEEGLDLLRKQAAAAPAPPTGFQIKSAADIALAKQQEFEAYHPQLALWMKIKAQLADSNGDQYFQGQLKDAALPQLTGTLVEAKPACHPRELLVAVVTPDSAKPLKPEISLKLDRPLAGKPETDTEFRWWGVPTAFTKDPFLLTMETEPARIEGLTTAPCSPAPEKPGAKNSAVKK